MLLSAKSYARRDTTSVFFPFNESNLTDAARRRIDSAIYAEGLRLNQSLRIIGYTDAVGGDSFNVSLSRQRAASVMAYLIQSGFRKENITLIVGKGEAEAVADAKPGGYEPDRRVDIVPIGTVVSKLPPPQRFYLQPVKKDSNKKEERQQRFLRLDLSKMEVGKSLVLNNIYFYPGRHVVREDSYPTLNELYEQLRDNPTIRIRVEGHVCCVNASDALDNDTHILNLSVSRAQAIRDYMIKKGIDAARMEYKGFGRSQPVVQTELTEDDANRNRRVEVRVIQ